MGTFSIWHWLIILLATLLPAMVAIFAADQTKRLNRKQYAIRLLILFIAIFGLFSIASLAFGAPDDALGFGVVGLGMTLSLVAQVLLVLWSVHRVQDIGWSRWICLLYLVPGVGTILWFILLFKAGVREIEPSASTAA